MTTEDLSGAASDAWLDAGLRAAFRPRALQVNLATSARSVLAGLSSRYGLLTPPRLEERTGGGDDVPGAAAAGRRPAEGRYRQLGEIARGGVGIILRSRDVDLGREVAMKVLRDELSEDAELLRRFVEEAQIAGQLQHPGIVPVYELGLRADGRPYFTMKLVKGSTLAALLAARRDPSENRTRILSIFEAVCHTVAYAHARGVVHRDLKPGNVMVGAFGEVQVVDWGLAKVLERAGAGAAGAGVGPQAPEAAAPTTLRSTGPVGGSRAGAIMGTPRYMPPEQARGDVGHVDERADVFALGGMLCEILTGAPPYPGEEAAALELASRGGLAPAHARLEACGAPAELVALALACLTADPEARPRDAGAVAATVAGWRAGVEERARAAESEAVAARARADVSQAHAERQQALAARAKAEADRQQALAAQAKADAEQQRVRAAAEQSRAEQERRARRLTLGVAALCAAVLTTGAVGWRMVGDERSRRAMETLKAVEGALGEAAALAEAAGQSDVPEAWAAAAAVARRAARLAVDRGSDADTQARARTLGARLEEETRVSKAAFELRRRTSDLASQGYAVEAIATARKAIELRPTDARARIQLAELLSNRGQLAEAVEQARAAVAAKPDLLRGRQRLASLLLASGDGDGALSETRAWAQLAPDEPDAQFALGQMLLGRGDAEEAVEVLSRAARSWPDNKECAQALERAQHVARRSARLPAVLRGEHAPAKPEEWIEYAQLCGSKELYVAGSGLWEHILGRMGRRLADAPFIDAPTSGLVLVNPPSVDPSLYRVEAAMCTLSAGLGMGKDAVALDDDGRRRCRARALGWLKAVLAEQRAEMEREKAQATPGGGVLVLQLFTHQTRSLIGPDTPIGKAIESLPEDERAEWRAYRAESEATGPVGGIIRFG